MPRTAKSIVGLQSIICENTDNEIANSWHNLMNGVTSKFDSTKKRITLNKKAYVTTNARGQRRHCWTVNVTRYGVGLKGGKSILPYHLALISKFGTKYKYDPERRMKLQLAIMKLGAGKNHITHTCGNGRSKYRSDKKVCCNPRHLRVRTKEYNAEQSHCHHFLHRSDADRQKFYESGLCSHRPKCF